MKNLTTTLFFCLTILGTAFAQKERKEDIAKNCQLPTTLKVSKGAYDLLESYKKLLNPTANNLCTSASGYTTSFGMMGLRYYGNPGKKGNVSFASTIADGNTFRTIFANKESDYTYYGVCVPNPIVWDASESAANHLFAAKLIDIPSFVNAGQNADFAKISAINTNDIKSIDCMKMEEANGYAAATETANYNNTLSSKGILVLITLKTGVQQWCYLINNYDTAGTIIWKE
jgi:hypothetical protein